LMTETSILSQEATPGYEIEVSVLGLAGITSDDDEFSTLAHGKPAVGTKPGRRMKAIVGFLQENSDDVFVTTGFSRSLGHDSSGKVIFMTSATDASTGREVQHRNVFTDLFGIQRFTTTWDRESTDERTGLGPSVLFEAEEGAKKSIRLLVALADCSDELDAKKPQENPTPITAYPLGICTIDVETKADELRTIVDVPVHYLAKDDKYKPIRIGYPDEEPEEQQQEKPTAGWLARKVNKLKCTAGLSRKAGEDVPPSSASVGGRRPSFRKRKSSSQKQKTEKKSETAETQEADANTFMEPEETNASTALLNHLKAIPVEQAVIRLDVDLKRKESNVEITVPNAMFQAANIKSLLSFGQDDHDDDNDDDSSGDDNDGPLAILAHGATCGEADQVGVCAGEEQDSDYDSDSGSEDDSREEKKRDDGTVKKKKNRIFSFFRKSKKEKSEAKSRNPNDTPTRTVATSGSLDGDDVVGDEDSSDDSSGILDPKTSLVAGDLPAKGEKKKDTKKKIYVNGLAPSSSTPKQQSKKVLEEQRPSLEDSNNFADFDNFQAEELPSKEERLSSRGRLSFFGKPGKADPKRYAGRSKPTGVSGDASGLYAVTESENASAAGIVSTDSSGILAPAKPFWEPLIVPEEEESAGGADKPKIPPEVFEGNPWGFSPKAFEEEDSAPVEPKVATPAIIPDKLSVKTSNPKGVYAPVLLPSAPKNRKHQDMMYPDDEMTAGSIEEVSVTRQSSLAKKSRSKAVKEKEKGIRGEYATMPGEEDSLFVDDDSERTDDAGDAMCRVVNTVGAGLGKVGVAVLKDCGTNNNDDDDDDDDDDIVVGRTQCGNTNALYREGQVYLEEGFVQMGEAVIQECGAMPDDERDHYRSSNRRHRDDSLYRSSTDKRGNRSKSSRGEREYEEEDDSDDDINDREFEETATVKRSSHSSPKVNGKTGRRSNRQQEHERSNKSGNFAPTQNRTSSSTSRRRRAKDDDDDSFGSPLDVEDPIFPVTPMFDDQKAASTTSASRAFDYSTIHE